MKTKKLIRNALVVLTIVFMSAVLCGAGCSNAADSPSSGGGGGTSLNAIERLIAGGSIKDGSDIYKFFPNKTGEKSGGSSGNMRNARAAGGKSFSWSADLSGTLTITMDDASTAPVFKFTVTNGVLGECKKNGSTVTFTSPTPLALNEWEKKLVGTWYLELDHMPDSYKTEGHRQVLNNDKTGKEIMPSTSGQWETSYEFTWSATANTMTIDNGNTKVESKYEWIDNGNKLKFTFKDPGGSEGKQTLERMQ